VSDSKPIVLPQPLNSTNHLVFKPHTNYKQLGTVSRKYNLKLDLMIFHQNNYSFITFHGSKLGYNNLKDIQIFIFLNTFDTMWDTSLSYALIIILSFAWHNFVWKYLSSMQLLLYTIQYKIIRGELNTIALMPIQKQ